MASADVVIRDASLADVPTLAPIELSGNAQFVAAGHIEFDDGVTISIEVAERSVKEGRLIVAATGGTVVGWAQYGQAGDERCLGQISVLPSHQGQGVGAALLLEVIDRARADGESTLVLTTQGDVSWNRPWYERFGFVVVPPPEWTETMRLDTEAQSDAGLDWSTRVHMRLRLEPASSAG